MRFCFLHQSIHMYYLLFLLHSINSNRFCIGFISFHFFFFCSVKPLKLVLVSKFFLNLDKIIDDNNINWKIVFLHLLFFSLVTKTVSYGHKKKQKQIDQNQIEIPSQKPNLTQNWIHTQKKSMKFLDRGPSIGKIMNAFYFLSLSLLSLSLFFTTQWHKHSKTKYKTILHSDCVESLWFFSYCVVFFFYFGLVCECYKRNVWNLKRLAQF